MKSKNLLLPILAVILLAGVLVIICFYYGGTNGNVDTSNVLSPSKAYLVCNQSSCTTEEVTVRGNMIRNSTSYGIFSLSDDQKTVYIDLIDSGFSVIDAINFHEKFFLEKDGIVEIEVTGSLKHEKGMCTMSGCSDLVKMTIKPEQIKVIKKVGCKSPTSGKSTLEGGDCFDVSYRKMSLEEAYLKLFSSNACIESGRRPSRDFSYDSEEGKWRIGISSTTRPGGCSEACLIDEEKVIFSRTCAVGSMQNDLELTQKVEARTLEELYQDCLKGTLANPPQLGPAREEPIGATRIDSQGNVWTKTDEVIQNVTENGQNITLYGWKTDAESYKGTTWADMMIDEQPGGINYERGPPIDCELYLKKNF